MKKKSVALLILTVIRLIKRYPPLLLDIAYISIAQVYLRVLKNFRTFLVFLTQTALSLCLLFCGVIMIHISMFFGLFLLVHWSASIKILVIFLVGGFEVVFSLLYLRHLFSEKKWMEAGKTIPFIEEALKRDL